MTVSPSTPSNSPLSVRNSKLAERGGNRVEATVQGNHYYLIPILNDVAQRAGKTRTAMRERLPHSNKRHGPTDGSPSAAKKKAKSQRQPNHSSKKKGMVGAKHRRAVGIGVVKEMAIVGHAQAAGAYFAARNSCEQAVFAAFAGEMGLSVVKAQQEAPRRKERGALCGGYRAALSVLSRLISLKAIHDGDQALAGGDQAQTVGDTEPNQDREVEADFTECFLKEFGSLKCAEIQAGRKDCLDVITGTARIVEAVIKRYGL